MTQTGTPQRTWFAVLVLLGLVAVMAPAIVLAAGGGGQGFDAVVTGIESRYHVHATRIPFMGLISVVAGISTHGGVHGLHVAEIEHFDGPVDGAELNALVEQHVGQGWQRMIRETSRSGDQTLIYVRPEGSHMGMMVVDLSGNEMDVVQMSVDPQRLTEEISKHHHDKEEDSSGPATDTPKDSQSDTQNNGESE